MRVVSFYVALFAQPEIWICIIRRLRGEILARNDGDSIGGLP